MVEGLGFDADTVATEKWEDGQSLVVSPDFDPGEDLPSKDRDLF